jgi:adenosine deaminase
MTGLAVLVYTSLLHSWPHIVNRMFPVIAVLLCSSTMCFILFGQWKFYLFVAVFIMTSCILIVLFRKEKTIDKNQFNFLQFLFIVSLVLVLVFLGLTKRHHRKGEKPIDNISAYFESIRDNEAALASFFQAMPKGGDLHNHYGGSLYAEHMLDNAIANKNWINLRTLKLDSEKSSSEFLPLDSLSRTDSFGLLRQRIYQGWSIKDYYDGLQGTDQHFFDSFNKMPKETKEDKINGMQELIDRAMAEHVSYLELMTSGPNYSIDPGDYTLRFSKVDGDIRRLTRDGNTDSIHIILENWYQEFSKNGKSSVDAYLVKMKGLYDALKKNCAIRYLIQGYRESRPADLFRTLTLGFMAAEKDSIIVGVNIVQREDGPVSMRDYKLHMEMFRFLHEKLEKVRYSMHAGELTLGSVPPEDLTFHIHDAVFIAAAQRIGHGVDLPFEADQKELLDRMREKKVAIEINLWSNEFILKISRDKHPILQYFKAGVPIVISTDDAGILRSSMTHQYVLLAMRYKEISYDDIKQFIRNSIEYSFIRDKKIKDALLEKLNDEIKDFERTILK